MPSYIKVENNIVVQCLSYLPEIHDGDWREAIEINPNCIPNRQMIGAHTFDLTKSPVEITWEVIDISVEERKQQLQSNLKFNTKEFIDNEIKKEFDGDHADITLIQDTITWYHQKVIEIDEMQTHTELDTYMLEN